MSGPRVGLNYLTLSGRRFIAIWPNEQALANEAAPLRYCLQAADAPLPAWSEAVLWAAISAEQQAHLYRQIRRQELPPHWQEQIKLEIARARQRPMPRHLQDSPLGQATPATLKQCYRQSAKSLHPDQGGQPEQFMALQTAYQYLCRYWRL